MLLLIGEALLEHHGLYQACHVERATARRFLRALEAGYGDNPYHNAMHGADVALGVHRFLTKFNLVSRLTKLQLLAAIVGAIVHDFNHPGTTTGTRCVHGRTRADACRLGARAAPPPPTFTLLAMPAFDLFGAMPPDERDACCKLLSEIVLATDLAKHFEFVSSLRALAAEHGAAAAAESAAAHKREHALHGHHLHLFAHHGVTAGAAAAGGRRASLPGGAGSSSGGGGHGGNGLSAGASPSDWKSPFLTEALVSVPLLLGVAIKFADLGHCFKPLGMHKQWTERVTKEFWALGDRERRLGVALSPLCDRQADTDVPKSQIGFFKFVCIPFYSVVADLVDPAMLPWLRVQANLQTWQLNGGTFKTKLRATGQAAVLSRSITSVDTKSVRDAIGRTDVSGSMSIPRSARRGSVAF